MYACDFESTTQSTFEKEGRVRVWAWQSRNINTPEISYQGLDIESFMEWVVKRSESTDLYFHNLKYDGNFIIDYLLNNGWIHVGDSKPFEKSFDTLITDGGAYFQITLYLKVFNKRQVKVNIKDSLKKLPLSIAGIAKTFDMDTLKGDLDYNMYRPVGYEPTASEWNYIDLDTKILANALKQTIEEQGMTKLTIASDAMEAYKETLEDTTFRRLYPVLNIEADNFIRASYRGGFVYVKPEFAGKVFEKTTSYDVNSLYPSVMYNKLLPFGLPKAYEGKYEEDETYPLYIQHIRVDFSLKYKHIPTIQAKGNPMFQPTTYLTDSEGETLDMYLTSVDLELFLEHHDIHYIEYVSGLKFRGVVGLFKNYIDHWSHIKESTTGGARQIAKLMLNSLYGKFAMRPERRTRIPYLEKGKISFELKEHDLSDPIYTAMASFITSYARGITIGDAQKNFDRFIYADTDSIHLIGHEVPDNLDIHDAKLGYWACEGLFGESKFLRPKTYVKKNGDKLEITCAGLPTEARNNVTFDNFKLGAVYGGKLSNSVVKGGSLLRESNFTISK